MKLNNNLLLPIALLATAALTAYADDDPTRKEPFFVNQNTIYMTPEADADKALGVTTVSEGLWARKFPDGYQFYNLQGQKFTDSRWDLPGVNAVPRMTRWGVIVKKAGADYNAPYILVRPDGSEAALPAEWSYPTPFVDSLAIVRVKEGNSYRNRYITPDLKIVFPDLSPCDERFEGENNTTPPLSEGLRAYCTKVGYNNLWGYIDKNGNVVIEPQFREARSFHCGLALVKDTDNNKFFINKSGNKAFEPQWKKFDDVSDYDSGLCAAPGDRFDKTDYYDLLGNKVTTVKHGTAFHNGYAYCYIFDEALNKDFVHKIDTNFTDCGVTGVPTSNFREPEYDACDVAHFTSWVVDGAACNVKYFYDYSVDKFSKEGYAPATMTTNDGKSVYKGFIDRQGHFKLVYETKSK